MGLASLDQRACLRRGDLGCGNARLRQGRALVGPGLASLTGTLRRVPASSFRAVKGRCAHPLALAPLPRSLRSLGQVEQVPLDCPVRALSTAALRCALERGVLRRWGFPPAGAGGPPRRSPSDRCGSPVERIDQAESGNGQTRAGEAVSVDLVVNGAQPAHIEPAHRAPTPSLPAWLHHPPLRHTHDVPSGSPRVERLSAPMGIGARTVSVSRDKRRGTRVRAGTVHCATGPAPCSRATCASCRRPLHGSAGEGS